MKVSLREVCSRVDYGLTAASTLDDTGTKFLRITDIDGDFISWSSVPYVGASEAEIRSKCLEPGDVVVARTGASVGRSAWVNPPVPAVFASYLVRFRADCSRLDSRFLGLMLRSAAWRDYVSSIAHGKSAQPNMSAAAMAEFEFDLPDFTIQRAIAEVLGALDDKIAANERTSWATNQLAEKLFQRATHAMPRVPASRILTPILGGTPNRAKPEFWSGDLPWVSAKDITAAPSGVILETAESISIQAASSSRAKPVPAGSVILTARGTVGAVARLAVQASFNQSCYAFLPNPSLPPSALYFIVRDAAANALSVAHGSVFSTITMRSFDALTVPALGQGDLSRLEGALAPLLALVTASVVESKLLANLRDALLPHLMSGRITVRDAEKAVEEVL